MRGDLQMLSGTVSVLCRGRESVFSLQVRVGIEGADVGSSFENNKNNVTVVAFL